MLGIEPALGTSDPDTAIDSLQTAFILAISDIETSTIASDDSTGIGKRHESVAME
jgi:hypothetical protein